MHGAVAAIGNFDGVHLGHRALVAAVNAEAARLGRPRVVMTFEPHPRRFFVPSSPPFRLDALSTKARILSELVIDAALAMPFVEIGRDSCRERLCTYVYISVVGVDFK